VSGVNEFVLVGPKATLARLDTPPPLSKFSPWIATIPKTRGGGARASLGYVTSHKHDEVTKLT